MAANARNRKNPRRRPRRKPVFKSSYADLLRALGTPLRRTILRKLHNVGEARSPIELARMLHLPVSDVSYHVRQLFAFGVLVLTDTGQKRGAVEHFYMSTVSEDDLTLAILRLTEEEDQVN